MRIVLPLSLAAVLTACQVFSCSTSADDDECAGSPMGDGYTLSPGPAIHEGYYSRLECQQICTTHSQCAPVVEQLVQPRFRCGEPPPAHCGPRHTPRANVRGPCDSEGFDKVLSPLPPAADGDAAPPEPDCSIACGPFTRKCAFVETLPDGRHVVRCGEPLPEGCERPRGSVLGDR